MAEKKSIYKNLGIPDEILDGIFEVETKNNEDEGIKEAMTPILNKEPTKISQQPATNKKTDKKTWNVEGSFI